ncbi:MAG: NAD(P)/FAD-dependent oxidoreductase [Burkholderiales bacterium]|nr:NAD(P)/FAD-dependent oxidoreductase [Burkholderiales bacterium]
MPRRGRTARTSSTSCCADPAVTTAAPVPPPGEPVRTDALIIGAGPVGLFQVFQLGLLEIRAQVVDVLTHAGGQCAALYADKPLYDIPALPRCSGHELTQRLLQQIRPFGAGLHLGQLVTGLQRQDDGRWTVLTRGGPRFDAGAVVIAGGAGAFQPRTLKLEGLDRHEGTQLHYALDEPAALAGRHVVVVGGGEIALDWALALGEAAPAARPARVTLVHRRDTLDADPAGLARLQACIATGAVHFVAGQPVACAEDQGRLVRLDIATADGGTQALPLDTLLVGLGLSPRLGPIADWGLALERRQLRVDTETYATGTPGIFAVGDINTYPGKKKLIVCGFHEATLAAYGVARHLHPDRATPLQYTTTSPRLHALLGVSSPAAACD